MIDRLTSYFGFSRMPFGRDLAPGMLHRHSAHNEAVARIGWCIAERRIGVITGEVGAGKTVAVRAALAALDRSRHTVIYLPDPTVGVRGIHHRIVASLGGQPLTHHAILAPQAADALAAEAAERGRTPVLVIEITDRTKTRTRRSSCVISGTCRDCLPTGYGMSVTFERRRRCGTTSGDRQAAGATDRPRRWAAVVDDRVAGRDRVFGGRPVPPCA